VLEDGFEVMCGNSSTGNNYIRMDAIALNIAEIYYEDEIPINRGGSVLVHSFQLDNGEKIILDSDPFSDPNPCFFLVNYLWDKQNQVDIKDKYIAELFINSRLGFSGSLNDILSVRYPGLQAKINFDYDRYCPVINGLLSAFSPEVNTLKIPNINTDNWDDFKVSMNGYMESKNTGFE